MYECSVVSTLKNFNGNKNICMKLNGEVGMVVPKITQTRVVGVFTYLVHSYAYFSDYGAIYVFIARLATLVCPLHISEPTRFGEVSKSVGMLHNIIT